MQLRNMVFTIGCVLKGRPKPSEGLVIAQINFVHLRTNSIYAIAGWSATWRIDKADIRRALVIGQTEMQIIEGLILHCNVIDMQWYTFRSFWKCITAWFCFEVKPWLWSEEFLKSTLFKLLQLSVINMMLSHNEAHMKIIFGFLAAWLMSSRWRWRTRRKTKAILFSLLSFQNPCLSVSGVDHLGALESADNDESCLSSSLVPCTPTYLATQISRYPAS